MIKKAIAQLSEHEKQTLIRMQNQIMLLKLNGFKRVRRHK